MSVLMLNKNDSDEQLIECLEALPVGSHSVVFTSGQSRIVAEEEFEDEEEDDEFEDDEEDEFEDEDDEFEDDDELDEDDEDEEEDEELVGVDEEWF